jgi:putative addiction module component (TIGR02574 family)
MIKTEKLIDDALSLPVEIRAEIIEALLLSLNPTRREIDKIWAKEAEARVEDIKKGRVKTKPGKEVFKKIFDRLEL